MIVADASTLVERLLGNQQVISAVSREMASAAQTSLCAPDLIGLEVLSAVRRLERLKVISSERAWRVVGRLGRARVHIYPHGGLQGRAWELRHNLSIYDACYVALAELLGASLLMTCDQRMAEAATSALGPTRILYVSATDS